MGYDLSLTLPVMENVVVPIDGMTYNINRLLAETRWVGLKLKDLHGFTGADAATVLKDVYEDWHADPESYRIFEVSDWGSLDACLRWVIITITILEMHPRGILEVSA